MAASANGKTLGRTPCCTRARCAFSSASGGQSLERELLPLPIAFGAQLQAVAFDEQVVPHILDALERVRVRLFVPSDVFTNDTVALSCRTCCRSTCQSDSAEGRGEPSCTLEMPGKLLSCQRVDTISLLPGRWSAPAAAATFVRFASIVFRCRTAAFHRSGRRRDERFTGGSASPG